MNTYTKEDALKLYHSFIITNIKKHHEEGRKLNEEGRKRIRP
jgi:hypothetical protein